ncbi:hypothetical protein ACM42_01875 [Bradyrhizobium sp. CCBAU 25338]|nr:hypothetical protein [Bradyrhizobium sp. CCBAU 45389]MDA9527215.1 hypothetical protein [Bradyrhizobium sp. CCBAU 25338]RXH32464.1 hypothetical protein XH84_14935 [Bradyrhizobium nanningense]
MRPSPKPEVKCSNEEKTRIVAELLASEDWVCAPVRGHADVPSSSCLVDEPTIEATIPMQTN